MNSTNTTTGTTQSLKENAGQLKDKAAQKLSTEADARKDQVAGGMKKVSSALDSAASELDGNDTPDWLKQGFAKVAQSVNSLAAELESTDSQELTMKLRRFARQRPGTFLGACGAAGFAAARVFMAGQSTGGRSSDGSRTAQNYGGTSATGTLGTTDRMSGASATGFAAGTARPYGQDADVGVGTGDAFGHASPTTGRTS